MACKCGQPPDECLDDAVILWQLTDSKGAFRNSPRPWCERALSLRRGGLTPEVDLTPEKLHREVTGRRLKDTDPPPRMRRTTVGALRAAGFVVIHAPGPKLRKSTHVSVVWPSGDWMNVQNVDWPTETRTSLDGCFSEERW
jgi:hypothetical protein